jgi:RNA polymerase sigma factor (sigma-70 family)
MARLLRVASDERLVQQVRAGSDAAFEVIYDRYHRGLLSFCRHMLGQREEAEDALQQTLLDAHRGMLASERDIQLRPWLYTIARNRCLSVLRARRERPRADLEDVATEGLAAEVQRREDLREILHDLAELPDEQRAALVLAELGALPHEEIARVLEVPKDKVKALVFQARSSLLSSRQARETPCQEIREMLATLHGGSLRRNALRRHLRVCAGCRDFQAEVKRQRRAIAAVLPVVPTIGLKESALAAVFGGSSASAAGVAAAGAGAATAGAGGSALAAKVAIVAVALGGGATGVTVVAGHDEPAPAKRGAQTTTTTSGASSSGGGGGSGVVAPAVVGATLEPAERAARGNRRGQRDRGKEFAKTRGKGRKRGLLGTQPGQQGKTAPAGKLQRGKSQEAAQRSAAKRLSKPPKKAKKAPKIKAVRQRPVQPVKTPRPTATPRPTPAPRKVPAPTATPEVTPVPVPEVPPEASEGGGGALNKNK